MTWPEAFALVGVAVACVAMFVGGIWIMSKE